MHLVFLFINTGFEFLFLHEITNNRMSNPINNLCMCLKFNKAQINAYKYRKNWVHLSQIVNGLTSCFLNNFFSKSMDHSPIIIPYRFRKSYTAVLVNVFFTMAAIASAVSSIWVCGLSNKYNFWQQFSLDRELQLFLKPNSQNSIIFFSPENDLFAGNIRKKFYVFSHPA